jgi:hypothetical protein
MKKKLLYITSLLFCFLTIAISCTEEESIVEKAVPGTYIIETSIQAIKDESTTRGINEDNDDFDVKYDPNTICLHIIGSEDYVTIPLYPGNCSNTQDCKCFSYHISVSDNGDAVVTPMDEQGNLLDTQLAIPSGSTTYFSSVDFSIWELDETQIYPKSDHVLYTIDQNVNQEIYRSLDNFSIKELTDNGTDLVMGRACAGFTVLGLFYDAEAEAKDNIVVSCDFESIMGSESSQWYIKIYSGGDPFVNIYNLGTMNQENASNLNHGYYATGDFSNEYKNNKFKQFSQEYYGLNRKMLICYGYCTPIDTRLLTPALNTTTKALDVYILIKHWEGEGEPSEEWLHSDEDALYTRMNITGEIYPYNNCFYTLGLLMDIRQFKAAWEDAQNSRPSTRSGDANGMHYFELKNSKVICERHY